MTVTTSTEDEDVDVGELPPTVTYIVETRLVGGGTTTVVVTATIVAVRVLVTVNCDEVSVFVTTTC